MSDPNRKPVLRIALADDHRLVRSAIARLLRSCGDMDVVAESADGAGLLEAFQAVSVDLAVIDVAMPDRNGFDTIAELLGMRPAVRAMILSVHTGPDYLRRSREVGAHALVSKDVDAADFVAAIRRVARGERFVAVQPEPESRGGPDTDGRVPAVMLTRRQHEVLGLVVDGLRTTDIAERLGVSVKTIETHRADLMQRLAARNMAELVREALRLGVIAGDR